MTSFLLAFLLAAQAPARPCAAPEHRQFDFWVGDWVVHDARGQQLGTNRIETIEGGCGLQENWRSATGGTGRSLNFYRPASGRWVQAWVGGGSSLLLEGGRDGRAMVLEGESLGPAGERVRNRITWSPLEGGRVRQLWEQSADGGRTWTVAFDGTYSRRAADGVKP